VILGFSPLQIVRAVFPIFGCGLTVIESVEATPEQPPAVDGTTSYVTVFAELELLVSVPIAIVPVLPELPLLTPVTPSLDAIVHA
jgi:hypothetical protein